MLKMVLLLSFVGLNASALPTWYLGAGVNSSHPFAQETFRSVASSGKNAQAMLGYSLWENTALELEYQQLSFESVSIASKSLGLSAAYRPHNQFAVQPVFRGGLGGVENKPAGDTAQTGLAARLGAGLEYSLSCLTLAAGLDWRYLGKVTADLKDTQAVVATFGVIWPSLAPTRIVETKSVSRESAPAVLASEKIDSDKDGVMDEDDKCPGSPVGAKVNSIGCSETEKAVARLNIEFASGSTVVAPENKSEISKLVDFMKKHSETSVEIAGHTDSLGNAEKNKTLSQKRAEAVRAEIVSGGIEAGRVKAVGYGPAQPVADNKTASGRKINRRVEAEISIQAK